MPRAVSIVHVPGHQKGDSPTARGNRVADLAAQKVADEDFITPGVGDQTSTSRYENSAPNP